jgi:hypothetical protein
VGGACGVLDDDAFDPEGRGFGGDADCPCSGDPGSEALRDPGLDRDTGRESCWDPPPGMPSEIVNLSGIQCKIEIEILKEKVNPPTGVLGGVMGNNHSPLCPPCQILGGSPPRIHCHRW